MLVVRPIETSDYDTLYVCAEESGHGFTSLPVDKELLTNRIERSTRSFTTKDITEPGGESYLMVGYDTEAEEVVGTTAIEASIGWNQPVYSYHISKIVQSSAALGVNNVIKLLTFGNNYTGCTEICTLFLRPAYRQGLNGKLLSKCRFLLMAEYPEKFSKVVIAEMRGISDEQGHSPFWKWLQDNFFSIEFTQADYLIGIGKKEFIADLMPKLPIYINLLSDEAQAVIGKVHPKTVPALKLLEKEGFVCRDYVDIFDAGPTVECDLKNIESVRNSFRAKVKIAKHTSDHITGQITKHSYLVSNTRFHDFRATATQVEYQQESGIACITPEVAAALEVTDGDDIRLLKV